MMEVMTDNKNRTVPDIRHIMSKNGGNLGESGCVNWMFEKKGIITLVKEGVDEDAVLEKSLELGADENAVEIDSPKKLDVAGQIAAEIHSRILSD